VSSDHLQAFYAGVRLLSRRAMTEGEVAQSLQEKGFSTNEIQDALQMLAQKRYVDDESIAQRLVSKYVSFGYGRAVIYAKLRQRYLSDEVIASALEEERPDPEKLVALVRQKYRNLEDPAQQRRAAAFLCRRGFSMEHVRAIIRELSQTEFFEE